MAYTTILNVKPKKENKKEFCQRICNLLNDIIFCSDGYVYNDGQKMLNVMFKYSKLNNGYANIDDLLNEADKSYSNIFDLCRVSNINIDDEEILVNIDILVNSLYSFKKTNDRHFYEENQALEIIGILFKAVNQYLLSNGYKLEYDEDKEQVFIVVNEIAIDMEEIKDENLKSEIISFYDYKNDNNIEEKKKIILILIGKLESRKNSIEKLLGAKIADMYSNYANNLNLRHNNISEEYKKYYNKTVANLNNEEMIEWYNYIFAFMINIYLSLDKLKDINVNGSYK